MISYIFARGGEIYGYTGIRREKRKDILFFEK